MNCADEHSSNAHVITDSSLWRNVDTDIHCDLWKSHASLEKSFAKQKLKQ